MAVGFPPRKFICLFALFNILVQQNLIPEEDGLVIVRERVESGFCPVGDNCEYCDNCDGDNCDNCDSRERERERECGFCRQLVAELRASSSSRVVRPSPPEQTRAFHPAKALPGLFTRLKADVSPPCVTRAFHPT